MRRLTYSLGLALCLGFGLAIGLLVLTGRAAPSTAPLRGAPASELRLSSPTDGPVVHVSPSSFEIVQEAGDATTRTLTVSNVGSAPLRFLIADDTSVSFFAVSTRLYGYDLPLAWLRIIGTEDDSHVRVVDLHTGSIIAQNTDLDRYALWDVHPTDGTYYKVEASKPVLGYESDWNEWSHTAFVPSLDAGPVGKRFIFYSHRGGYSGAVYVFAVDNATVNVYNTSDALVVSKALLAGSYWDLVLDNAVYRVESTGRIAIESVASNGYSTVPSINGAGVGYTFYFATHGDHGGAFAVFAYANADVAVHDLDSAALLYSQHIDQGNYWWQDNVGGRRLRLESSGPVEVWAGDSEGGPGVEGLGDDTSFAAGEHGRTFYLHSLMDGSVIFAPFDDTRLDVDGALYHLDADGYLHLAGCCYTRTIVSDQPILIQTLGRDTAWNDLGTALGGVTGAVEGAGWLTTQPTSGTVTAFSTAPVQLTFDAAGLQPGLHTAPLIVHSNDPFTPSVTIPISMTVLPSADMGRVAGTVSDAWTGRPITATVELIGVHAQEAAPTYTIWAQAGAYSLTAYAPGYVTTTTTVQIGAGGLVTRDLSLWPTEMRTYLPIVYRNYCPDFFDAFGDPGSGWEVWDDDYARSEYLNGEYRVLTKRSGYYYLFGAPTCSRVDYDVEVDARWVGAPGNSYGLLFGLRSDYTYYYFFDVNTDSGRFRLYRRTPDGFTNIVPATASGHIRLGTASNHLAVRRRGSEITLWVNGMWLGTWYDSAISGPTGAGVMVSPYKNVPTADARFDNFSVVAIRAGSAALPTGLEGTAICPYAGAHRTLLLAELEQWSN